jgi:hypothetical protein
LGQVSIVTAPGDGEAGRDHDRGGRRTTSAPTAVEHPLGGDGREHGGQRFRGSMTLQEVAEETGLSVDRVRNILSLPNDTPADEHLGRLGRERGFDMHTVRTLLEQHGKEGTAGNVGERMR